MFTYAKAAEKVVNLAEIDWQGKQELKETCLYGMEMLIALLSNCFLVILVGVISGTLVEVLIYTVGWGSLRILAGGRHAKNHLYCILTYLAVMFLVICVGKYIAMFKYASIIILLMMLIGTLLNGLYAGSQKENKKEILRSKKKTWMVLAIECLSVCFLLWHSGSEIQVVYGLSIFSGAVLAESLFLLPKRSCKSNMEMQLIKS